MILLHDPGNTEPKPLAWAWVTVDADGNEGLCAAPVFGPNGGLIPLVTMSAGNIPYFEEWALRLARMTGKTVRRVRFGTRVVEATLSP
jgi:hypothetical protein